MPGRRTQGWGRRWRWASQTGPPPRALRPGRPRTREVRTAGPNPNVSRMARPGQGWRGVVEKWSSRSMAGLAHENWRVLLIALCRASPGEPGRAVRAAHRAECFVSTLRLPSLMPSRRCRCALRLPKQCRHGDEVEAGLLFPLSLHTVLAVKVCACCARWRPVGRLRTCDSCAAACRFRSRAIPPEHWSSPCRTICSLPSIPSLPFRLLLLHCSFAMLRASTVLPRPTRCCGPRSGCWPAGCVGLPC